ncbi:MAG: isomerase [Planctomycetes bacterium RBG_16_64_10]|nr:MAG: isomerase [Planctomycetes bacterium RBG_16_64_10]
MKFGMNLLLWSGQLDDRLWPTVEMLQQIGYDGVELPLFEPDDARCARWGKQLDNLGLERTAVAIRGADDNPISPDPAVRARAVTCTKRALDGCQAAGCSQLVGPLHSALGQFSGAGPTADEWQWGVETLAEIAEYAGQVGVTLGIECLNRFETYLLNTHADAVRFVRDVGHPRCRVMYDTFHAHIEEKDVAEAIRGCGDLLVHVHVSENDRSTPGSGNVRWDKTFDALREIGYDGWLVVEAFGLALPEIAAATKIWRRMFQSEAQLARDALAFMRREVEQRW